MPDSARACALVRLALAEPANEAQFEGKARACAALAVDLCAGHSIPLDFETLHAALKEVVGHATTSTRGVSAILRAANALERLDAHTEPQEAPSRRDDAEYDPFEELDRLTATGSENAAAELAAYKRKHGK
jgi:hypothetical protein